MGIRKKKGNEKALGSTIKINNLNRWVFILDTSPTNPPLTTIRREKTSAMELQNEEREIREREIRERFIVC